MGCCTLGLVREFWVGCVGRGGEFARRCRSALLAPFPNRQSARKFAMAATHQVEQPEQPRAGNARLQQRAGHGVAARAGFGGRGWFGAGAEGGGLGAASAVSRDGGIQASRRLSASPVSAGKQSMQRRHRASAWARSLIGGGGCPEARRARPRPRRAPRGTPSARRPHSPEPLDHPQLSELRAHREQNRQPHKQVPRGAVAGQLLPRHRAGGEEDDDPQERHRGV